jgi:hypothetical protein
MMAALAADFESASFGGILRKAQPARGNAQAPVVRPQCGTRRQLRRGEKMSIDIADAKAKQAVPLDE